VETTKRSRVWERSGSHLFEEGGNEGNTEKEVKPV